MIDHRPIEAALSRDLGGRSAPVAKVEAELDAFISKRHDRRVAEEGELRGMAAKGQHRGL